MSREEAIIRLKVLSVEFNECKPLKEAFNIAFKALKQPKPKKGYWITTDEYFTGAYESIDYVKCSCCREDSLEEGDYCPNCGAKMDEVRNE